MALSSMCIFRTHWPHPKIPGALGIFIGIALNWLSHKELMCAQHWIIHSRTQPLPLVCGPFWILQWTLTPAGRGVLWLSSQLSGNRGRPSSVRWRPGLQNKLPTQQGPHSGNLSGKGAVYASFAKCPIFKSQTTELDNNTFCSTGSEQFVALSRVGKVASTGFCFVLIG